MSDNAQPESDVPELALNDEITNLKQELVDKNDFLTYIHHELNGFIHNIHFFSDYLMDFWNKISNDKMQQYLGSILESAEYLKLLSEDLFNLSRFSSGEIECNFQHIDLKEIIQETVNRCRKIFLINKDLEISFDSKMLGKTTKAFINGDNGRIRQLLFNLVINSIKYSKKGTITIRLETRDKKKEKYWKISVIDQGMGIPENDLEYVFEPFFKVSKANSLIPSFGLGLSLCKRIVEAHGGTIKAINNPDQGVTFTFCIPAYFYSLI